MKIGRTNLPSEKYFKLILSAGRKFVGEKYFPRTENLKKKFSHREPSKTPRNVHLWIQ